MGGDWNMARVVLGQSWPTQRADAAAAFPGHVMSRGGTGMSTIDSAVSYTHLRAHETGAYL
eukprot:2103338-Pyramimonas_sp.AAC.1